MRALAKEPDQRYGSAEEMDADLARVARGVAVSRETEDAMTQVLAGAGPDRAQTMITRPRAVAAPPAPPAYRRPTPYYDYEEPPRGRSIWPWLLALGLIIAGAIGGYLLYTKIQDQLNANKPVAVPDVVLLQRDLATLKIEQAGLVADRRRTSRARQCRKGQVIDAEPRRRVEGRQGLDGDAHGLDRASRRCRCRTCVGQDVTAAVAALAGLGLNPKIVHIYSSSQPDTVTAQQSACRATVSSRARTCTSTSRAARSRSPVPT